MIIKMNKVFLVYACIGDDMEGFVYAACASEYVAKKCAEENELMCKREGINNATFYVKQLELLKD